MDKYSKIELLALIKIYNKSHDDKIKNVDKLKKEDLIDICQKYALLEEGIIATHNIDLRNISKKDLIRDVQLYFMKQNQNIPADIAHMRKQELIDYMELNAIKHYTSEILEKEFQDIQKYNTFKNVITYNIIRYDNVDVMQLTDDNLQEYITENNLDVNIENLQAYAMLLHNLHNAYETFCKNTAKEYTCDKIKSIPKILRRLKNICHDFV